MSDTYQSRTLIPGDHPSLNGHFLENPIVPGVVILERVAQALESWRTGAVVVEFPEVKFHQLLRPDQWLEIRLQKMQEGRYRFECDCAGQVIASGTFISRDLKL